MNQAFVALMILVFFFFMLDPTPKKATILLIIGVVLLLIMSIVSVSAAENSAPAENLIVVEKPACPTEFNVDDSSWVLRLVDRIPIDAVSNDPAVKIAPDATYLYLVHNRIFRKIGNLNCIAVLFSYGMLDGVDGKRVWGWISLSSSGENEKKTFFLLLNNDSPVDPKTFLKSKSDVWESGDDLDIAGNCDGAMRCRITFTLYKKKLLVVSRVLDIVALRVLDIGK